MPKKSARIAGFFCLFALATLSGHHSVAGATDPPARNLASASLAAGTSPADSNRHPLFPPSQVTKTHWAASFANFPLIFEANQGQTDPQVDFLARGRGYSLFLTPTEAVLSLQTKFENRNSKSAPDSAPSGQRAQEVSGHGFSRAIPAPDSEGALAPEAKGAALSLKSGRGAEFTPSNVEGHPPKDNQHATVLRMKLVGANPDAQPAGRERLPTRINYFKGNDPKKWATDVPTYARVRYPQVYPGIDLVYYGNSGQLEYDFVVAPGADPSDIQLEFEGTEKLEVNAEGDLVVHLPAGDLRFHKPHVYQEGNTGLPLGRSLGARRPEEVHLWAQANQPQSTIQPDLIPGSYVLLARNQVAFQVGAYDSSRPLIIDPVLSYSTFLGGSNDDGAIGIAVDSAGNTYITGGTFSTNFPIASAQQSTFAGGPSGCDPEFSDFVCGDAFVAKIDPTGSTLLYSTYLGGSEPDSGAAIAVDSNGNAYVAGGTESSDFPTTPGAFDTTCGTDGTCNDDGFGNRKDDVFLTKLSSDGSTLVYSTYIGGNDVDEANGIALDSAGNVYLTGLAESPNYPVTQGAFQTTISDQIGDVFVTKVNSTGSGLIYSTFLGGTGDDIGIDIALNSAGQAYVTGFTQSSDFPTANPLQANLNGLEDAFVSKLTADASALLFSTYLGGSGDDEGTGIAVDSRREAYVVGETESVDFPLRREFDSSLNGTSDVFVARIKDDGSDLIYSTYLGGSNVEESGFGNIAVDSNGNAVVTGITSSTNFPIVAPIQIDLDTGPDAFVARLNAGGELTFSTYFGGGSTDVGLAIALGPDGGAHLVGLTGSTNFPTLNAVQGAIGGIGSFDAFVAKIAGIARPSDNFDDATTIPTPGFGDEVDTSGATTEPDDPTPSCGGGSRDNSVWYQFTPDNDGIIHLDSLESDYDTIVSVWTGEPGSLSEVACDDDGESREDNSGGGSGGGALVLAQTIPAGNSSVSFPANGGTTYFIMVSGKGGGGGLTISLAFQATSNPLPPNTVGTIIPHSALGGGFLSRVFITNLSNNLNRIVINRVGQPGSVIDSASTFLEPAATAQVAASEAARTGDLTIEWFTIGSEADVASSLLFEFDSASLNLPENFRTAVGTLAAEPLSAFTVPVRVATVEVTAGLALADLSGSSNTVNLTLRDQNGATVAQDSLTLAAFEQTAFSLQDRAAFSDIILGVPEFIGSLAVETADPNQSVAAIVIGNNLRQLYALPVIPGVASGSGSALRVPATRSMVTRSVPAPDLAQSIPPGNFTTLIPHSAAGGGFLSRLFVVNLTGNTNNLTINRIGQDGSVVTTTDAMLAPAGTLMLPDDEAVRSENLTIEWFAIGSEMPIGASLLFEFDSASLNLPENFLTAVGSLAADPLSSFTTPIRVATVDVTAGVALANSNDASTTVNLSLLNQAGTVVAQDSITLDAFEQTAFSLQDRAAFSDIILGVPEFIGALAVTSDRPVAALVIGNNLGQLFALPVTPGVAQ